MIGRKPNHISESMREEYKVSEMAD